MFKKILVANRGEIAVRIIRACKELNIPTVAVHSDVDSDAMHVRLAEESICIGSHKPQNSYLNIAAIMSAADITDADAIHPGYGFLSENPEFAKACIDNGIEFVGPTHEILEKLGNKTEAKKIAESANIPIIKSIAIPNKFDVHSLQTAVKDIGYPLIIKASWGGGGRGMRVVFSEDDLLSAVATTKHEAELAFGNGNLYLEKYLANPRHIEIQVLSDSYDNSIYFGDCISLC